MIDTKQQNPPQMSGGSLPFRGIENITPWKITPTPKIVMGDEYLNSFTEEQMSKEFTYSSHINQDLPPLGQTVPKEKEPDIILIDDDDDNNSPIDDKNTACNSQDHNSSDGSEGQIKRPAQTVLSTSIIKKTKIAAGEIVSNEKVQDAHNLDKTKKSETKVKLRPLKPFWGTCTEITKVVALDCEMVRVVGKVQAIARCSIVNYDGHVLFDSLFKPEERVVDYLTWVSGITHDQLIKCNPYSHYQEKIFRILKDAIIVGHSLRCDFEALKFDPNPQNVRDLAKYKAIKENKIALSLKNLAAKYLKARVQNGAHNSIEDARAAMALYRKFEKEWEKEIEEANRPY